MSERHRPVAQQQQQEEPSGDYLDPRSSESTGEGGDEDEVQAEFKEQEAQSTAVPENADAAAKKKGAVKIAATTTLGAVEVTGPSPPTTTTTTSSSSSSSPPRQRGGGGGGPTYKDQVHDVAPGARLSSSSSGPQQQEALKAAIRREQRDWGLPEYKDLCRPSAKEEQDSRGAGGTGSTPTPGAEWVEPALTPTTEQDIEVGGLGQPVEHVPTVQAQLIQQGEPISSLSPWWRNRPKRRRVAIILAIVTLVTAGIFAAGFCGSGACSPTQPQPPTQPSTPAPTPVGGPRAFQDTRELIVAVDEYLGADDPNATIAAERYGHPIGKWDVSLITDFTSLFDRERIPAAASFHEDLSEWDISKAVSLRRMFYRAEHFNSNLNNWNTERVEDMSETFTGCSSFNGAVSNWNTGSVTSMAGMFHNATSCKYITHSV
jgi:surface protein